MGDSQHHQWLTKHKHNTTKWQADARSVEVQWSTGRLLLFAGAVAVWFLFDGYGFVAGGLSVGLIVLFALAVRRHQQARDKREHYDQLLVMIDESLQRCGGSVVVIRSNKRPIGPPTPTTPPTSIDTPTGVKHMPIELPSVFEFGPSWATTEQERDDLDLYGEPVGIFGLLNRTSTSIGTRRLSSLMENPSRSNSHINARQNAVTWLEQNTASRLDIMAAAAKLRKQDKYLNQLTTAVDHAKPLSWHRRSHVLRMWSIISLALSVVVLINVGLGQYAWCYLFALLFFVNGSFYLQTRKELNELIEPWKSLGPTIKAYLQASTQAASSLSSEGNMSELRSAFQAVIPKNVLPALSRRVGWAESGGMFHAVCNALYFYDLHVVEAILRPAAGHREALLKSFCALADLEALCSLACFAYESASGGSTCYPVLADDPTLDIKQGRHPLIDPTLAVPNSLKLDQNMRIQVITGSNMAGKSTYLRMCGINCLLAQLGTVALAKDMKLSPLHLITDLQVRDNLSDEESYFLAEVRQVRRMIAPEVAGLAVLGLIDEPFRGTNSSEQVAAALAVLEYLHESTNLYLMATHEQRLTELVDDCPAASNVHFQENLGTDGLVFDYNIQTGPARTRNALRVLEREGYPAALLDRARAWLDEDTPTTEHNIDSHASTKAE